MSRVVIGDEVVKWVASFTGEYGNYGAAVGFGVERDGKLIAGVVYNDWNGVNINQHCASVKGSHWMSRNFLWYCFDYPFNQLKVKRITGLVGEGNAPARRLNEHLGFVCETTLEDAHPTGKIIVYRMRKHECRWLNLKRPEDERMAA
jgi:hypothetical protein